VLRAFDRWAREHAAPAAQTRAPGALPSDYWLNLTATAGLHLTGVEPERAADWVKLLGLGELSKAVDHRWVKPHLAQVLKKMDDEDSRWVVEFILLGGDLSVAYDGFLIR